MTVSRWIARSQDVRSSKGVALSVLALAAGAGPASAHDGDPTMVHSCIVPSSGYAQVIGPNDTCSKNSRPQDWPAIDTNTTYSAGSGLALTGTEFSVTGAPWGGLTDMPLGFADGVDDVGSTAWSDLTGVPGDLADGDDDGTPVLTEFSTRLATNDGVPNESGDLVSFSQVKDLQSAAGGNILGSFIQDDTIESADVRDGGIRSTDLAGHYAFGSELVPGAVTSEKIKDGTISGRDLGPVVSVATVEIESLDIIEPGSRYPLTIAVPGVRANDLVVVSPPETLEEGLLFVGTDIFVDGGAVIAYLHNITDQPIDPEYATWTVRWLDTDG